MVASSLAEDYQRLDVHPGASLLEVERAYLHLRTLYADGTLASYGLIDRPQRERCLEEIEAAYVRIGAARRQVAPATSSHCTAVDSATAADHTPGALLRQARLQAGMNVRALASTLKIGHLHLQNIEEERYEALPATVYLRGFLLSYAKALQIPHPEDLTRSYLARRLQTAQGGE